jgi:outer membrane lipoprotein-sorting protein
VTKAITAAIGFLIAICIPFGGAQTTELTVDQIIQKHTDALGGLDHLRAIQTVKATGNATLMGGQLEAPVVMEAKRPTSNRMEMTIQDKKVIQAFDGTTSWSINPFTADGEPQKATEEDAKAARDDADFVDGALVDYKAKGNHVELVGKEDLDGAVAYKLKVTKKSGTVEYDYLDAKTFLPVKSSGQRKEMGHDFDFESFPRDFRAVNGVMMPYSLEQRVQGKPVLQLALDEIVANTPIDDSEFRMPDKPPAPKQ